MKSILFAFACFVMLAANCIGDTLERQLRVDIESMIRAGFKSDQVDAEGLRQAVEKVVQQTKKEMPWLLEDDDARSIQVSGDIDQLYADFLKVPQQYRGNELAMWYELVRKSKKLNPSQTVIFRRLMRFYIMINEQREKKE